jgi:predicted ArsR family transcriptional regulator
MERGAVAAIAALDDGARSALYAAVRASDRPVTREEAAAAVGISRKLAAFHLDKLVVAGLLRAELAASDGRRVGRAPKVYRPAQHDVAVHLPGRDPGLLADILLDVVAERPPVHEAVTRAAHRRGARVGEVERDRLRPGRLGAERALRIVGGLLERQGYEPRVAPAEIRLRNCPFHPQVDAAPNLVCGLNRSYLAGLIEGLGAESALAAVLRPQAGSCCVRIRPRREVDAP